MVTLHTRMQQHLQMRFYPSSSRNSELLRWIVALGILTLYYSFPLLSNKNKQNLPLGTSLLGSSATGGFHSKNNHDSHLHLQLRSRGQTTRENYHHQDEFQYVFWLLPAEPYQQELQRLVNELASEYHTISFEPHVTLAQPVSTHNIPNPQDALDRLAASMMTMTTLTTMTTEQPQDEVPSASSDDAITTTKTTRNSIILNNFHVAIGQLYTQSIFLQFEENTDDGNQDAQHAPTSFRSHYQSLRDLYMRSRQISRLPMGEPNVEDHFPHMSLMYLSNDNNKVDNETRNRIAADVRQKLKKESSFFRSTSSSSSLQKGMIAFDAIQLVQIQLPVQSDQDVQKWKTIGKRYL